MTQGLINKKVQKAFSKAAVSYDDLTSFHQVIALKLANKIRQENNLRKIIDVGMGTGFLADKLCNMLPDSKIIGADFSREMIAQAKKRGRGISAVQADACELPFDDGFFDAVVSNLAYQWVSELNSAFNEANRILNDNGRFIFTVFGYDTFKEVFESLEESLPASLKEKGLPIKRLHSKEEIEQALLENGFTILNIKIDNMSARFKDMFELLKWSKAIGSNALDKDIFIGRDLLNRANEYFVKRFSDEKSALSTFQIIWVEAQK